MSFNSRRWAALLVLLAMALGAHAEGQDRPRRRGRRPRRLPDTEEVLRRQAMDDLVEAYVDASPDLRLPRRSSGPGRTDHRLGPAYLWNEGSVYVLEIPGEEGGPALLLMRGTRYGSSDTFIGTMTVLRIFTSIGELGALPDNWLPSTRWLSYENHFRLFTADLNERTRLSLMVGPRLRILNWVASMQALTQLTLEPGLELDHYVSEEVGFTLRVVGGAGASAGDGFPTEQAGSFNAILELHLP